MYSNVKYQKTSTVGILKLKLTQLRLVVNKTLAWSVAGYFAGSAVSVRYDSNKISSTVVLILFLFHNVDQDMQQ